MRIAVDVGGTFTDVCVALESGEIKNAKVPSTVDPIDAVIAGATEVDVPLDGVAEFRHGTTVATNALITRDLPAAAMVTTRGFRDVLEIGRGTRPHLWDTYKDTPPPYIARRNRLEVTERTAFDGSVEQTLAEDEVREVAQTLQKRGVEAVAVCFLNAHVNDTNERACAEILAEALPGVAITTSSEVLPQIFEHERFSTTVANAMLSPLVAGYVQRLQERLSEMGYAGDLLILHSGGGVMTPEAVHRLPVRLAGSGIAAGAIAAREVAANCGIADAIGLDMGGTSTDISLVSEGKSRIADQWEVEFDHPICLPSIEVLTVGAGGGSIAWIDDAMALHSGPQSAGATPGPAAYGRGGTTPTTSDANLLLGRLGEDLIGGQMKLDRSAAEAAIVEYVAGPLGLDPIEASKAIITVTNANMADALRVISVQRGYDPRDFALVVFGGGGPLHAVALARELSIPEVVVPPNPGTTSAFGCLLVDIQHDLMTMYFRPASETGADELEAAFADLEGQGRTLLEREGIAEGDMVFERTVDMRYEGQWRSLSVAANAGEAVAALLERFSEAHQRAHRYLLDAPVEIYRLNVRAIGRTEPPTIARHERQGVEPPPPDARRLVHFDEADEAMETPVYDRARLGAGTRVDGPAIVSQLDSTTLVPPGISARVDEFLNIRMTVEGVA